MNEVDVFTATRGPRKDAATSSTDNHGWESRRVAALCVGLCKYTRPSRLSCLSNAARDAVAFKKKVDAMPNRKSELLENVESEKEFRTTVRKFLTRLQKDPHTVVLFTCSGHGCVLNNGTPA